MKNILELEPEFQSFNDWKETIKNFNLFSEEQQKELEKDFEISQNIKLTTWQFVSSSKSLYRFCYK